MISSLKEDFKILVQLAWKELRHSWRQLLTVFAILFVGFLGPLIAGSLRSSTSDFLRGEARDMLSADLAMVSSRPFERAEIEAAGDELKPRRIARETDLMTMASVGTEQSKKQNKKPASALISVHGVSSEFPIYSKFKVKTKDVPDGEFHSASELQERPIAWAFRDVLIQLGLEVGDRIRLGERDFEIVGELLDGPGALRAGFAFAPNLYIGLPFLQSTGLVALGSQVNHRVFFELGQSVNLAAAGEQLKKRLPDPEIFLRTPDDSIRGIERFLEFFAQYLGVITLIVFALSWVSAFYILEIFLFDRLKPSAVLLMVGGSRLLAGSIQVVQVFLISVSALLTATALLQLGLIGFRDLINTQLPEGFLLTIHLKDFLGLALMSFASALAFTVPFWVKLSRLRPGVLLTETSLAADTGNESWAMRIVSYLPLVLLFLAASVWLLDSFKRGSMILTALIATVLIGWLISRALFRGLFSMWRKNPGATRLVATNLSRGRFGTDLCFMALTLVTLILNLVPHLLESAVRELKPEGKRDTPALFLFNIPENAVPELQSVIKEQGAELRYLSPMISARLEKVNGALPKAEFLQKFPVRVTYREQFATSERLVAGELFSGKFDPASGRPAEVSIETQYAERQGFALGDLLTFDVQGLPIEAKIVNFRRVRWTDFHPNFFIEFQSGVLEEAPKTFISNVGDVPDGKKPELQFDLIRKFPDLSVVDVGDSISKILSIVDAMLGPIRMIAGLAVAMSLIVLLAVIGHNLRLRQSELEILKVLGADSGFIRRLIVSEYFLTGTFASLVGSSFALAVAAFVTIQVFDIANHVSWTGLGGSYVIVIVSAIAISYWSVGRRLSESKFLHPE